MRRSGSTFTTKRRGRRLRNHLAPRISLRDMMSGPTIHGPRRANAHGNRCSAGPDVAVSIGEKGSVIIKSKASSVPAGWEKSNRAPDPRLGRHVALKFLSGPYAAGSVALGKISA